MILSIFPLSLLKYIVKEFQSKMEPENEKWENLKYMHSGRQKLKKWEMICYQYVIYPKLVILVAPHSSTLAWKIHGRGSLVGCSPWGHEESDTTEWHDWVTSLSLFTFMHWRRKWQPTPVFLPGEPQGQGAWWAAVYGVAQSQTRLKRLSSSSSSMLYTWN